MSLPHALLGMISYRPGTGYDLKAAFKESIYYFWNATLPQIYRTLNQLEADGWLVSSMEHQDGKPSRKVYEITMEGRAEFLRWLTEPPEMTRPKQPLLMKIFFGNQVPADALKGHVTKWRDYHARMLARYEGEVASVIERYEAKLGSNEGARYWAFTLDYGKRQAQMTVDWCNQVLKELETEGEAVPQGR
jgi:PadR family transcriptional regulator, regulatory protein AphA